MTVQEIEAVWAALRDLARIVGNAPLAPIRDELRKFENARVPSSLPDGQKDGGR